MAIEQARIQNPSVMTLPGIGPVGPDVGISATPVRISLSTFVDFVMSPGTAKVARARTAKAQYSKDYDPFADYWRGLRRAIEVSHRSGLPTNDLDNVVMSQRNQGKRIAYDRLVRRYRQWIGDRRIEWVGVQAQNWRYGGLEVRVNPELGVRIDRTEHVIKLYFKAEPLSQRKVDAILHLLATTVATQSGAAVAGILDVPRGRLMSYRRPVADMEILLKGEATALRQIWDLV